MPRTVETAVLLGRMADREFRRACERHGLDPETAMSAPIDFISDAQSHTEIIRNQILNLWALGMRQPEIALMLGCGRHVVHYAIFVGRKQNDPRAHMRYCSKDGRETRLMGRAELTHLRLGAARYIEKARAKAEAPLAAATQAC